MSEAVPPPPPPGIDRDHEQLNLLAIFHFVYAGLGIMGLGFLGLHYTIMSRMMDEEMWQGGGGPPPAEFFQIFRWLYLVGGLACVAIMVLNVVAGLFLRQRRHRIFTLVVAGLNCLNLPMGTALGVFTIVVLMRPSVIRIHELAATESGAAT
ncbi:MAG: hypothetical protein AAGI48_15890 [Verrucomicrobiota bacterium]